MDIFSQKKFMIWTIALLVLLNIVSMAALWYQRGGQPPPPQRQADQRQESVTQFLNRELQLTEDQKKDFEQLRRDHLEASTKLNQKMRTSKKALFDLAGSSSPDKTTIEQLTKEIGDSQTQLELLLVNHFIALRKKCTPEQQVKFDAILHDLINLMRPQNPGGERPQPPAGDRPGFRQQPPDKERPPRDQNDQRRPPRQGGRDSEKPRPPEKK
jgi:protein CpxP